MSKSCKIILADGGICWVSWEDRDLANYNWYNNHKGCSGYAIHSIGKKSDPIILPFAIRTKKIPMHRLIALRMGLKIDAMNVDHINRNSLDNRRANLRAATSSQNHANTKRRPSRMKQCDTGYKGVYRYPPNKSFTAYVQFNGRTLYIGSFKSASDAARAYDNRARELFGEFASLNFGKQTQRKAA